MWSPDSNADAVSFKGLVGKFMPRALRERLFFRSLKKALRKRGLTEEQVNRLLGGWKTKAGGILGILTGATMIVAELANGSFDFDKMLQGFGVISAGFAVLGLGGKVEKNTAAVMMASSDAGLRHEARAAIVEPQG